MQSLLKNITNLLRLEEPNSVSYLFYSIIGISLVRTFLEGFSSLGSIEPFTSGYTAFTHFLYFYFSIILSLSLLLHFLTKIPIAKILNLFVRLFPIIWLPPLIDLIITKGHGWQIGYDVLRTDELVTAFFTYFGHLQPNGVTPGIRIEILLILLGVFLLIYINTNKKLLAITGTFLAYCVFFIYAALPNLIALPWLLFNDQTGSYLFYSSQLFHSWLASTHTLVSGISLPVQQQTDVLMARIFWIATIIQTFWIFKLYNLEVWKAWKKNLRLERVFYYCAIGFLGMLLCKDFLAEKLFLNLPNALALIIFFLLIGLNAWLAVIVNDETDCEIDKVSNPDRPLVKNTITHEQMRGIGFVLLIYTISGIVLLNYLTFYLLLMFQLVYFIYSAYPLRLKRCLLFSSPLLGLNALAIAMAGFFLVSPDQFLGAFPQKAFWFILIGFSILANIKDIKDYEGDLKENIQTIPTVLGLKNGKILISILSIMFLLIFSMQMGGEILFFATIPFAISLFYFINKKVYREINLFYLFFLYIGILVLLS